VIHRLWKRALEGEFFDSHAQTTIAHLPAIRLSELMTQIPPPTEQQRIVTCLSEQIAAAERTRKALEEQLGTIQRPAGSPPAPGLPRRALKAQLQRLDSYFRFAVKSIISLRAVFVAEN